MHKALEMGGQQWHAPGGREVGCYRSANAKIGWTSTRILVVDDYALTRIGLRAILSADPGLELIAEATNGAQALALALSLQPDLVLMDIRTQGMDGLQTTRILKERSPRTAVLILSTVDDPELLIEAVKAGAAGYVLKAATEAEFRSAIWQALAGEFPVDRHLVRDVLRRIARERPPAHSIVNHMGLSPREHEVLELLARGHTNREIAELLIITHSTVKIHVEHILAKLGVSDRTQAAVMAIERGYITPGALHLSTNTTSSRDS